MENQQKTGSFKFRGATFKVMQLTNEQLAKGVITASAGNHAQGVAYASRKLGVKAIIYMPEKTPHSKVEATQNYGAEVVLVGSSFQEAYEASMERQRETGATYVHPFDDYDIMRSEEHTSELQSRGHLVCRLLLEKKKKTRRNTYM